MISELNIDIWSDIACPWCYLGKKRFEEGVQMFQDKHADTQVNVTYHSYELAPDTPERFEGSQIDFLTKRKGLAREQVEQMLEQLTQLGESENVIYNFDILRTANTRTAHRVLHLAQSQGVHDEMLQRLYRAYFEDGLLISDRSVLAQLGEEIGLDADEVLEVCDDSERFSDEFEDDLKSARMLNISGVPFYLIEEKYGISGAQSAESFAGALDQVLTLRNNGE